MKRFLILFLLLTIIPVYSQHGELQDDYKFYGRKQPLTPGSVFNSLGSSMMMVNPANVAYVTDNRITGGGSFASEENGYGYFVGWLMPNFSIGNAWQANTADPDNGYYYKKLLSQFTFGFSTNDLGLTQGDFSAAFGLNIKQQGDFLYDSEDNELDGGRVTAYDLGLLIRFKYFVFEYALFDVNEPTNKRNSFTYYQGHVFGARYESNFGLKVSLQGETGDRYAGMDWGIHIGIEQSFFERRLFSRVQLTSYYVGSDAVMQSISGNIGYRFNSKGRQFFLFKDLEISYALSFLSTPHNIGAHMLGFTKYF